VGYYPNSSFIHLDVRKDRSAFWIDYSGPGERSMYADDPVADLKTGRADTFKPTKIDKGWADGDSGGQSGDAARKAADDQAGDDEGPPSVRESSPGNGAAPAAAGPAERPQSALVAPGAPGPNAPDERKMNVPVVGSVARK
jgi:hypothetical protein